MLSPTAPDPDAILLSGSRHSIDLKLFQDSTPRRKTSPPIVAARHDTHENRSPHGTTRRVQYQQQDPLPFEEDPLPFEIDSRFDEDEQDNGPSADQGPEASDDSQPSNGDIDLDLTTGDPESLPPPIDLDEAFDADAEQKQMERSPGVDAPAEETEELRGELSDFNDRDCRAEGGACRQGVEYLDARQRTDISLNITPSIAPREVDMARVDEIREEKLAKAPSRTWLDEQGKVLAEGKLEDFRNNRVYVRTLNDTLRSFSPNTLSEEDWCFVTAWWNLPPECRLDNEPAPVRDFRLTTFTWTSPATCHKPLYFEEVQLERYGHSAGPILQPILSGAHFFGSAVMLPYKTGLNPPNECQYTLGHYRPGDCAPWLVPGYPLSTRGFKLQGMALGAAIALLP